MHKSLSSQLSKPLNCKLLAVSCARCFLEHGSSDGKASSRESDSLISNLVSNWAFLLRNFEFPWPASYIKRTLSQRGQGGIVALETCPSRTFDCALTFTGILPEIPAILYSVPTAC